MPLKTTDPQLGPAMMLVALRTEHPELPPVRWRLGLDGLLDGTTSDPQVFAAYVEVFGPQWLLPRTPFQFEGRSHESDYLFVTWHDIELSLSGVYSLATVEVSA